MSTKTIDQVNRLGDLKDGETAVGSAAGLKYGIRRNEFQKVLPGVVIHSVRRIGPEMRAYTKNGMGYRLDTGYPVAGEYLYVLVPQRITRNFGKRSPGPRDIVIKTRN
jgi:hypothetical protein